MKNRKPYIMMIATCLCTMLWTQAALGDMFFDAGATYRRVQDSPFWTGSAAMTAGDFRLETFEDGLLNTAGVSGTGGIVQGPGSLTDSVDGDGDNVLDGQGSSGSSYLVQANSKGKFKAKFTFNAQGSMPTFAGLVFTDGNPNAMITFKAFDAQGNVIGKITKRLGDSAFNGSTAEDRFLGASYSQGISKIMIKSSLGQFEIDHLQFGNFVMAVVPLPPSVAMGAIGLLVAGLARKRLAKAMA